MSENVEWRVQNTVFAKELLKVEHISFTLDIAISISRLLNENERPASKIALKNWVYL